MIDIRGTPHTIEVEVNYFGRRKDTDEFGMHSKSCVIRHDGLWELVTITFQDKTELTFKYDDFMDAIQVLYADDTDDAI